MRSSLGETEVMVQGKELYCYNDGKSKLVDPAFAENYSYSDAKEFVFNRYNMEDVPKVKLSEVEYADEVEGAYFENVEKSVQTCVYTGGKTVALNEVLNQTIVVDSEAKKGYGIRSEEEDTTLYSFDIDSKTDGKTEVVAEDVEDIMGVRDGKIYYLTDVKNGSGELYCNDKNIDSDVTEGEVEFLDDDILYATDMNSDKGRYTLKLYDGKDDTKIADDVRVFRAFDKKHIAVLTDYRLERGEGDLKLYRGKKELYDLDEDVNWIFGSTRFYY